MSIFLVGVATFMFGFARFLVYVLTVRERFRSLLLDREKRAKNVVISLVILLSFELARFDITIPSGIIYIVAYGVAGASYSVVYAVSQAVMIAESHPDESWTEGWNIRVVNWNRSVARANYRWRHFG